MWSILDISPLIPRHGVSMVRILAHQGDKVLPQRALLVYLSRDTSQVIGVTDNVWREKAFQNKSRSCHSPSILQWSSVPHETHSLLSKTQRLFIFWSLLIFAASFPGHSPTYRQMPYSGLTQLHSFGGRHVVRDSHMLFLLPGKPILHLNFHPVDWAKSWEAFIRPQSHATSTILPFVCLLLP